MSKYTLKEIKQIISETPSELNDRTFLDFKNEGGMLDLGFYRKAGCNWSYKVSAIKYKGYIRQVVVLFGHIVAR